MSLPKMKITMKVEGRTTMHRNRYITYFSSFLRQRGFNVITKKYDDEKNIVLEAEETNERRT